MTNELVLAIIPLVAAPVGWVIKRQINSNAKVTELDKRQAVYEESIKGLRELINERFDDQDHRLERIERKVLNGSYEPRNG